MKKLIWLLLLVATSMWAQNTNYNPGTTAIILNAVTTTGTGTCYAMLNQGAIPANFTWQTVISGGTASSITVVFEGSLNSDCSNPSTIDTSTSTSGETRSVANKAYPYVTANITAYSRNGTTATVNFVAQYGSGIPTPSASNLCFVSQGAFQGSWTWKACSGAGGTLTSFSSGDLTGLFTTSVATATSTPALSFTAANFSAHTFWGNNTGSTAAGSAVQPSVSDLTSGALPNGTTATTQTSTDNTTDVATDAYVQSQFPLSQAKGGVGQSTAGSYGLMVARCAGPIQPAASTSEQILCTLTVPQNLLSSTGQFLTVCDMQSDGTSFSGTFQLNVRIGGIGGTVVHNETGLGNNRRLRESLWTAAQGSTSSQFTGGFSGNGGTLANELGVSSSANFASGAVDVVITVTLSNSGDNGRITLFYANLVVYP